MTDRETPVARPSLTKILATLGPATDEPGALRRLIVNGARAFRLNYSHGDFAGHQRRLDPVRAVGAELGLALAVVGDLQGPKIRVGRVRDEGIALSAGQDVLFRADVEKGAPGEVVTLPCTYPRLVDEVEPGHRVLVNDGAIRMLAVERPAGPGAVRALRCRVTVGGLVTTGKGINLPDSAITAPAITGRDWECVAWAVEHGLDYLALSFVRRGAEVLALQERLASLTGADAGDECNTPYARIPVIAKIEKPQAVANIDEILEHADALMVARGDLGVEMDIAYVPVEQKSLIAKAHEYGKPCIVATQMLESMIAHPTPTRAEVTDDANAIFVGADVVMRAGETAVGAHGPLAVEMMRRIARETEAHLALSPQRARISHRLVEARHRLAALAHGAWDIAMDAGAGLVACWSQSGDAARILSRLGLRMDVLAVTTERRVANRMAMFYGVTPILRPQAPEHRSDFDVLVDRHVLRAGLAKPGDRVVVLAGKPLGHAGVVNTVSLHTVGEGRGAPAAAEP